MDLESFKEIYRKKPVKEKLNKLMEVMEWRGSSRAKYAESQAINNGHGTEGSRFYLEDAIAQAERAAWLKSEIDKYFDKVDEDDNEKKGSEC